MARLASHLGKYLNPIFDKLPGSGNIYRNLKT